MNSFGRIFRVSLFGESHGVSVGVVVDGCPSGINIIESDFETDLNRRKAGGKGTTTRLENDTPKIMSGVFQEKTCGSPIAIIFENSNTKSNDYDLVKKTPRPGHADFTASKKYDGFNDYRGGGHFSGRLTLGLVAAGVLAKKVIPHVSFSAQIIEIAGQKNWEKALDEAQLSGDSLGGLIECRINGLDVGLGEPFFDKVEALLAHLIFAIPAVKGLEFGSGFSAAKMTGAEHNDAIIDEKGTTLTNNAGGMNGGLTNGNELVFRVAVKPTSSIKRQQSSFSFEEQKVTNLEVVGRHDACIALRVPVILEAAAAIVLADLHLIDKALKASSIRNRNP